MPKRKTSAPPTLEELAQRVELLEAQLAAGELEANTLTIRNSQGQVRLQLTEQGCYLVNDEGRLKAALAINSDGAPILDLMDGDMKPCFSVTVLPNGQSSLVLNATGSRAKVQAAVTADGMPVVLMSDQNGHRRIRLSIDDAARPTITLLDDQGETRLDLATDGSGTPGLALCDSKGRSRGFLALASDGTPSFGLLDGKGRQL